MPPRLSLHGDAAALAASRGLELSVSLTHSRELAAAAACTRSYPAPADTHLSAVRVSSCARREARVRCAGWSAGSSPCYDAERMRAVDAWAIDEQGVPSLELMEAAGRAVARGARPSSLARARPESSAARATTAATGSSPRGTWLRLGHEVEVLLLWPADELSADAAANLERLRGGGARARGRRARGGARGLGGRRRRDLRHRLLRGRRATLPPAAIEAINASGAARGRRRHRLRRRRLERRGRGRRASRPRSRSAFTPPSSGTGSRPASTTRGELRVAPIGIPDGAPAEAPRRPDPGVGARAARTAAAPSRPSSARARCWSPAARAGSRARSAWRPRRPRAPVPATRPWPCPAELEQIFEIKLTEVMSIGCASADGRLAPAAAEPILEAAERAAAVVLGPGLGRADEAFELVALARRPDRRAAGDRRRRPQRACREARAARHAGGADRAHPARRRARAAARGRLRGGRAPIVSPAQRRQPSARRRSSCSRATTRSSPHPATGRSSTALASPALATAGTGDVLSGHGRCADRPRARAARRRRAAAVHAHTRAGLAAADRVGAAESVIATDVIESIPAGLRPDGEGNG